MVIDADSNSFQEKEDEGRGNSKSNRNRIWSTIESSAASIDDSISTNSEIESSRAIALPDSTINSNSKGNSNSDGKPLSNLMHENANKIKSKNFRFNVDSSSNNEK